MAPFDFDWCLKLHREMFGDVWSWAGCIRTLDLNIGVPFFQITENMQRLLEDLLFWERNDMQLHERAARLHHCAVTIHPFMNGNGRWARMLVNIRLKQQRQKIILWPDSTIGCRSEIRQAYLYALRAADNGDFTALVELHERYCGKG